MRRIALPLLLALAVLGLAAACGGGDEGAGTTQTPATEPPPATETEAPATTGETPTEPDETITIDETLNLRVYLTRDDTIGVVSRLVPQTEAVGRVAMEELLGGPTRAGAGDRLLDPDPGRHRAARPLGRGRRRHRQPVEHLRGRRGLGDDVRPARSGRLHADPVPDRRRASSSSSTGSPSRRSRARGSSSTAPRRVRTTKT